MEERQPIYTGVRGVLAGRLAGHKTMPASSLIHGAPPLTFNLTLAKFQFISTRSFPSVRLRVLRTTTASFRAWYNCFFGGSLPLCVKNVIICHDSCVAYDS